jgi:hypothetical protein
MLARTRVPTILLLFVIAGLLFSGCLGAGVNDQTVEEFLEEVSAAFVSMDSGRIADLWVYPVIIEAEDEGDPDVEMEREDLKSFIHFWLFMYKIEGYSIETFEIIDSDAGEMEIAISDGKSAVVSNAAFHVKSDVPDPDPDDEFTQDLDPFSLIKIGKQWKFDGANEFLTGVVAGF